MPSEIPEQAGLVFPKPVVIREQLCVTGPELADGQVHEPPPGARPVPDQVQVVGTEQHRLDGLAQLPGVLPHPVEQDALGLALLQQYFNNLIPVFRENFSPQQSLVPVKADQLPVKAAAEAPARRQEEDPLQQIGLALGVGTGDHVDARIEFRFCLAVVPKAPEKQLVHSHGPVIW